MLKKVLPKFFFLTSVAKQNEKQRQMCEAAFDFLQWQQPNRGEEKKKKRGTKTSLGLYRSPGQRRMLEVVYARMTSGE